MMVFKAKFKHTAKPWEHST